MVEKMRKTGKARSSNCCALEPSARPRHGELLDTRVQQLKIEGQELMTDLDAGIGFAVSRLRST
jgi:hypothetical protein